MPTGGNDRRKLWCCEGDHDKERCLRFVSWINPWQGGGDGGRRASDHAAWIRWKCLNDEDIRARRQTSEPFQNDAVKVEMTKHIWAMEEHQNSPVTQQLTYRGQTTQTWSKRRTHIIDRHYLQPRCKGRKRQNHKHREVYCKTAKCQAGTFLERRAI